MCHACQWFLSLDSRIHHEELGETKCSHQICMLEFCSCELLSKHQANNPSSHLESSMKGLGAKSLARGDVQVLKNSGRARYQVYQVPGSSPISDSLDDLCLDVANLSNLCLCDSATNRFSRPLLAGLQLNLRQCELDI